jgi:hypothetical protein
MAMMPRLVFRGQGAVGAYGKHYGPGVLIAGHYGPDRTPGVDFPKPFLTAISHKLSEPIRIRFSGFLANGLCGPAKRGRPSCHIMARV